MKSPGRDWRAYLRKKSTTSGSQHIENDTNQKRIEHDNCILSYSIFNFKTKSKQQKIGRYLFSDFWFENEKLNNKSLSVFPILDSKTDMEWTNDTLILKDSSFSDRNRNFRHDEHVITKTVIFFFYIISKSEESKMFFVLFFSRYD